MTDTITCPYCDDFKVPNSQDGKNARMNHIYDEHDAPAGWATDCKQHDQDNE